MSTFEPKPFGKYFLVERIAIGGMAEIYKAKTFGVDGFEKLIAIKKILPHYSADKEFIAMLTDEAKLAVKLSHTNIVQVYDLGRVGDDYYISMEYIDGVNLREILNRAKERGKKIEIPLCLYIISEICKGLDYAHSKRDDQGNPLHIVHRDVSPQNILLSYEGETKIVDFGIAKAAMNVSHTSAGILKGKITYMAPEQASGKNIAYHIDIFSTGILLYELLTGERFFSGDTQFEVLQKVRDTRITTENLSDKIPEDLKTIVAKALAYNPNDRFETAGDFQIALTKRLYSNYPEFSPRQLSSLIQELFSNELMLRKTQAHVETKVDVDTRTELLEAAKRTAILAHKEPSHTRTIFQDTTKPQDALKPSDLDHHISKPLAVKEGDGNTHKRRFSPLALGIILTAIILTSGYLGFQYWGRNDQELDRHTEPTVIKADLGRLEIISEPDLAEIYLNGEKTAFQTPYTLTNLKLKKDYLIRLEKQGYQPWEKKVFFQSSDHLTFRAHLKAIPVGVLQVHSTPDGAQIFINQVDQKAKTPIIIEDVRIGQEYRITLKMEGYRDYEQTVRLEDDQGLVVTADLQKDAPAVTAIHVTSVPPDAEIYLNGQDTGFKTPNTLEGLTYPGLYTVELKKKRYREFRREVKVDDEHPVNIELTMELEELFKKAIVDVSSNVKGATILINGKEVGQTPHTFEIEPGRIQIKLVKNGYEPQTKSIDVSLGESKDLVFNLTKIKPTEINIKPTTRPPTPPPMPPTPPATPSQGLTGTGIVRVDSSPRGAAVTIDGMKAGITPTVINNVDRSVSHTIIVSLPGYKNWIKSFTLTQHKLELSAPLVRE